MRHALLIAMLRAATTLLIGLAPLLGQPSVTGVVNAASFQAPVAVQSAPPFQFRPQPGVPRGCLVSIFGSRLSDATISATEVPLPKKLGNTVVTVGDLDLEAPLYFVSPNQINVQIPFEVLGDVVTLTVTTAEGKSRPYELTLVPTGPGIFTRSSDGKGRALVYGTDFQPVEAVDVGETIILYATGLGPTDPPVLSGSPGSSVEPFNRVTNIPEVFVGEFPAQVTFAGLAPGLAGVYQVNVIPQRLGSDNLLVRSRGVTSNRVEVGLRAGQNVANASGTIQAVYPATDPAAPPAGYSVVPLVARITARMDILPAARPFLITAVSDAATTMISVDPVAGTFDASVTLPTMRSRVGDFSGTELWPIDLLTCHFAGPGSTLTCLPFPAGIIPASRIPIGERQALSGLPLPNTTAANSSTGLLRVQGPARAGSTFEINAGTNASLSAFAGYINVPLPPPQNMTTKLKLFIDGVLVASTDVTYRVSIFPPGFPQ